MKIYFSGLFIFLSLIGFIAINGCSGGSGMPSVREEKEFISSTNTPAIGKLPEEESPPVEQTTAEVSDQPYISPSGAFQIILPKGWDCSETGDFQVNCQSPDQSAELQARITATGYELVQEAFLSFTHAELVHAYSEIKEYVEIERFEVEGSLTVVESWRNGEAYWNGTDVFMRTRGTVFHLQTAARQGLNGIYDDVFASAAESAEIFPSALIGSQLYASRYTHTAPDTFFEINVPTSWGIHVDRGPVEKTVIEGFLSPDMRALVQITVYRHGATIKRALKAEKTLEIMRALFGYDLRVSSDKALPDGQERLNWYAAKMDVNGISYFDSYESSLYVFSIVWEEPTREIYLPMLEEIAASFNRE